MLAASNEWSWVPEGAPHVRTDEYLVVAYPDHFLTPTAARVFGSDRDACRAHRRDARDRTGLRARPALVDAVGHEPPARPRGRAHAARRDRSSSGWTSSPCRSEGRARHRRARRRRGPPGDGPRDGARRAPRQPERLRRLRPDDEEVARGLGEVERGLDDDSVGRVVASVDGRPASTGGWGLVGPVCRLWGGGYPRGPPGARRLPGRPPRPPRHRRAAGATLALTHGGVDTSSPILRRPGLPSLRRAAPRSSWTCEREAQHVSLEWDERGGVTVHMDGSPQSHVQPDDPTLLVFEYVQHLALAIDAMPRVRSASRTSAARG